MIDDGSHLEPVPANEGLFQGLCVSFEAQGTEISALGVVRVERMKVVREQLGDAHWERLLDRTEQHLMRLAPGAVLRVGNQLLFCIHLAAREAVELLLSELVTELSAEFTHQEVFLGCRVSIGATLCSSHADDIAVLMEQATAALREARSERRGWAMFDPRKSDRRAPLELIRDLERALERPDELRIHYQPKLDARTGRLMGVEGLVRWQHPTQGMLAPDVFIPLAEQSGLIRPLTRWILRAALRQHREWQVPDLVIALNLSAASLQDPTLPDLIGEALASSGVPGANLELEITETAMLVDPQRALDILTRLRSRGIRLSLDDFGTGYSSLAHLKQLPVDAVKIDRSFVLGNLASRQDEVIVESIVSLGHALGLEVVAEGVETREAWDKLVAMGCDALQGYYISRPVPGSELERRFLSRRAE